MSSEPIPINARIRVIDGTFKGHDGFVRQHKPRIGDYVGDYVVELPDAGRYIIASKYLEVAPSVPTLADTMAGVAAWQQEDAQNREVMVHLRGHRVTATVSLSPFSDAYTGTLDKAVPADAAGSFLDAVAMTRSKTPIRFGVAEDPPIADEPYAMEAE